MVQQNFYKDVNSELIALRKQNNELSRQIQEINEFRNPRQNHYSMHQQAYRIMPPFSQIMNPVNPLLSLDADKGFVSHAQLPTGHYSESPSIGVHDGFDESDELKDFRQNQTQSSDDTFNSGSLNQNSFGNPIPLVPKPLNTSTPVKYDDEDES